MDFAPTILSLMNVNEYSQVNFQGIDGSSELLNSSQVSKRKDQVIFSMDTGNTPAWAAAVMDGYKLVVSLRSKPFLFDLNIDPEEIINYVDSSDHAAVKADLQATLGEALSNYEIPMTNVVKDILLDVPACSDSMNVLLLRNGKKVSCNDIEQNKLQ